jgi:hypothetical protein
VLVFQLLLAASARNIKSSANKANQTEILVIVASGINVTNIYNSFSEFKTMFGVDLPDDRRIAFKNGEGKFSFSHSSISISSAMESKINFSLNWRWAWVGENAELFMNPFAVDF